MRAAVHRNPRTGLLIVEKGRHCRGNAIGILNAHEVAALHDFEAAVEEGATMVRVGTAIFGKRTYNTTA